MQNLTHILKRHSVFSKGGQNNRMDRVEVTQKSLRLDNPRVHPHCNRPTTRTRVPLDCVNALCSKREHRIRFPSRPERFGSGFGLPRIYRVQERAIPVEHLASTSWFQVIFKDFDRGFGAPRGSDTPEERRDSDYRTPWLSSYYPTDSGGPRILR